MSSHQ
ncbi:hypothetical protein MAR_031514 [Mya arenaria]